MKIMFVMEPRYNAGSIQAVANYIRAADKSCHMVAIYGQPRSDCPQLRFSTDVSAFDYLLFIFESNLHWPKRLQFTRILSDVPRQRRITFDADEMYIRSLS
jgi:hypothetical protein